MKLNDYLDETYGRDWAIEDVYEIDCNGISIDDFETLYRFKNLKVFYGGYSFDNIEYLNGMHNIQFLDLSCSKIKSIKGISQHTKLLYLAICHTVVNNIDELEQLPVLEWLWCDFDLINDIEEKILKIHSLKFINQDNAANIKKMLKYSLCLKKLMLE